jgi:hypothetical protein
MHAAVKNFGLVYTGSIINSLSDNKFMSEPIRIAKSENFLHILPKWPTATG